MIVVIATIETAPGRRNDLLAIFRGLVPKVHAEQGCLEYTPMAGGLARIGVIFTFIVGLMPPSFFSNGPV